MKIKDKKYLKFVHSSISMFIFGLVSCSVTGQILPKKQLFPKDYNLWGTLQPLGISDGGKWVSYNMHYESEQDTIFVKNSSGTIHYSFPKGSNGHFGGDNIFGCLQSDSSLHLTNLNNGISEIIQNVIRYDFSTNGDYLLTLVSESDNQKQLIIRREGKIIETISGITNYVWNDKKDSILYATTVGDKSAIGTIFISKNLKKRIILENSENSFLQLTWQHNGKSVSFFKVKGTISNDENQICYYNLTSNKLHTLSASTAENFPDNIIIDSGYELPITISDDGSKVFFGIKNHEIQDQKKGIDTVEIWNATDKWLYPVKKKIDDWKHSPKLAVWWPESGAFRQISTIAQPWVMLTGNQEYAIVANPGTYLPQYTFTGDMDYYIINLKNGKQELLLKKQSSESMHMGISPDGRYINYYREGDWWVYDIARKNHTNITQKLRNTWDTTDNDSANAVMVYGNPGWSKDSKNVLLYDAFDLWAISSDGSVSKRLTDGRQRNIRFTIDASEFGNNVLGNYSGRSASSCDLSAKLLIEAFDFYGCSTGYFSWSTPTGLHPLAFNNSSIDKLIKARNSQSFVYQEQTYDRSPKMVIKTSEKARATTLVESNTQQKNYYWGKAEMIHYTNSFNKPLNGALFYPANYDPKIKYPMVVYIYEKVSRNIHNYVNPSLQNVTGFNITNLTTKGYLVLLPDITYESSNPGLSATDCVSAAVKTVVDKGLVDPKKIGLAGHSFGGYETNFIITQTDIFAAAVSGSGVSDIISAYFSVGPITGIADIWRYENQQFRMGKSFYDNQEAYYRNSPIVHAAKITTPLLSWTGNKDKIIRWEQSMEFYLALRRLQKKHIMLVYPEMDHVPSDPLQQTDLTKRVEQWFDFFLKNEPASSWITEGFD